MLNAKEFINYIIKRGVNSFYGVPDSLLKPFCHEVLNLSASTHQITTNEGMAIALAIGNHLASKKISCVYMQNSGLGNAINPILSLASSEVYSIPMLLLIGWRGELLSNKEQIKDEPQHKHQGKITCKQLELLDIPYKVISNETNNWKELTDSIISKSFSGNKPVALVCKKNTFDMNKNQVILDNVKDLFLTREDVIKSLLNKKKNCTPIFSTTGMVSRELYENRIAKGEKPIDFYTVGGMGCVSSIALGFIRSSKSFNQVICIDGDGSLLMHMGSLFKTSQQKGFIHIVINNNSHDSVGGQPTNAFDIDFKKLGYSIGYNECYSTNRQNIFEDILEKALTDNHKSYFIEVKVKKGSRDNLGRPKEIPVENKKHFIKKWSNH
tara:strand:- start:981 stop:2126 length:1146 start_codon:yes stop_codon:yes gene_type:complete